MDVLILIAVFAAATWLGYKVISEVPSLLHTPLMSGSNAISGVTILGSLVATAQAVNYGSKALGVVAIVMACINLVGGYVVTQQMLSTSKKSE